MIFEGHTIEENKYTDHELNFLKFILRAYNKIPGQRAMFVNHGLNHIEPFIMRVFKQLKEEGAAKYNAFAVREVLFWFVGARVDINNDVHKVIEEVQGYFQKVANKFEGYREQKAKKAAKAKKEGE